MNDAMFFIYTIILMVSIFAKNKKKPPSSGFLVFNIPN